jgi:hypothetical protein
MGKAARRRVISEFGYDQLADRLVQGMRTVAG